MRTAAFFDLDKTICARPTESVFGSYLFKKREMSLPVLLRVFYAYARYDLGIVKDYDSMKGTLLESIFGGKPVERIGEHWERCYSGRLRDTVYRDARRKIEAHRESGEAVYVVSASLGMIVRSFCGDLGIENYYATELEEQGGRYTGGVTGRIYYGEKKADIVREIAGRERIDLSRSHAYGDSVADRFMLAAVGNPVAVNPDKKLRRLALANGWRIEAIT